MAPSQKILDGISTTPMSRPFFETVLRTTNDMQFNQTFSKGESVVDVDFISEVAMSSRSSKSIDVLSIFFPGRKRANPFVVSFTFVFAWSAASRRLSNVGSWTSEKVLIPKDTENLRISGSILKSCDFIALAMSYAVNSAFSPKVPGNTRANSSPPRCNSTAELLLRHVLTTLPTPWWHDHPPRGWASCWLGRSCPSQRRWTQQRGDYRDNGLSNPAPVS